jgi:DeoR family deoxyribose operon repressor
LLGKSVNKNQRLKEIVNILRRRNVVNIKELTQKLSASDMTIRRDLSLLAEDSIVELIPGGAIFKPPIESEEKYFVSHEETVRTREKLKIGQKAASFIEPNDTVIIDIGSTSEYVAKFMREDIPVTVLCFSLNILSEVYRKKNCGVIFAGGYYHGETMMFESPEGIELVKRTRADKAFVSAAGIHLDLGVTTVYPHELEAKKAILGSAKTRILVVDSSKFGKIKSVYFAELASFHTIITDAQIPDPYARSIQDLGVQLIVV